MPNCEYCGSPLRKGYGKRFCSPECRGRAQQTGYLDKYGYRVFRFAKRGNRCAQVYEHRIVMEQVLGRELTTHETVHHKNGIRHDNRPENLEIWSSRHGRGQRVTDAEPHWLPLYGTALPSGDPTGLPRVV